MPKKIIVDVRAWRSPWLPTAAPLPPDSESQWLLGSLSQPAYLISLYLGASHPEIDKYTSLVSQQCGFGTLLVCAKYIFISMETMSSVERLGPPEPLRAGLSSNASCTEVAIAAAGIIIRG